VTVEDVHKVAKGILKTAQLNLALVGRYSDEAKLKSLLKF
jgi:hypothetical protein